MVSYEEPMEMKVVKNREKTEGRRKQGRVGN